MNPDRLPRLAIWTRISCDALLLVGGAIIAWGMLFTSLPPWFFPSGILAAAIVMITVSSRKRRSRKTVAYLLLAILLNIAAITLLVASWGKLSPGVLVAFGYLAAWPTLALLWLFLDGRATSRIDRLTSVDRAEEAYQHTWGEILGRTTFGFVLALWVPAAIFYWATLIPSLITQVNSQAWPQTQGTIVLSEVLEESASFSEGNYNLVYRFEVDGKTYRGTRHNAIHPDLIESWRDKQLVEELGVGSTVSVHYRQTDPSQSLLQTGIDAYFLLLPLGMLFHITSSFGACFLLYDGELRFLLSLEKYELYITPEKMLRTLWPLVIGIMALLAAGICLVATDYAPTITDALAAWGITLAASYLLFCWIYRKAASELTESTPMPQPAICKA